MSKLGGPLLGLAVLAVCFGADDTGPEQRMRLAIAAQNGGDLAKAEDLDRQALAIFEENGQLTSPTGLTCLINLGVVLSLEGKLAAAAETDGRALALARAQPPGALLAAALNGLGNVLVKEKHNKQAEATFREAISVWRNLPGPVRPELASSLANLGALLGSQHNWDEATMLLDEALKIEEQTRRPDDPQIAVNLNDQAGLFFARKRYPEAERLLVRAKTILENQSTAPSTTLGEVLANLGEICRLQKRLPESREYFSRGLAILNNSWGASDPRLLVWLGGYAALLRTLEDFTSAETLEMQAMRIKITEALHKTG